MAKALFKIYQLKQLILQTCLLINVICLTKHTLTHVYVCVYYTHVWLHCWVQKKNIQMGEGRFGLFPSSFILRDWK